MNKLLVVLFTLVSMSVFAQIYDPVEWTLTQKVISDD